MYVYVLPRTGHMLCDRPAGSTPHERQDGTGGWSFPGMMVHDYEVNVSLSRLPVQGQPYTVQVLHELMVG